MGGKRGRLISERERQQAIDLVREGCSRGARKHKACELLEVSVRMLERWEKPSGLTDSRKGAYRKACAHQLTEDERAMILSIVNSKKYTDLPPSKIVPFLADNGIYIASESSIYRLLRKQKQLTHRQRIQPKKHARPKMHVATGPNQVWSWDISYLPTTVRGRFYYLYLVMDIFSRKIVGWNIHEYQSADYAAALIKQACLDEGIEQNQLILHSDNGQPMKGVTMLAMLDVLGVQPSFSRPSVSDDNPYSESLFKTAKYHQLYPWQSRFEDIVAARTWMIAFSAWYNEDHLHSGLKFVTPHQRHTGEDKKILEQRANVYALAKVKHPKRWSRHTRNWSQSDVVALNPNKKARSNDSRRENLMAA